jgi:hypothetical protein
MRTRMNWMAAGLCMATIGCTGGQTGDPGVADHTSIVRTNAGSGNGAVIALPPSDVPDSSGAIRVADASLLAADDRTLLLIDPRLGLRVIDVSDPRAPYVRGQLALSGLPAELHVMGSSVIIVQRFSPYSSVVNFYESTLPALESQYGGSAISLVDITDRSAPRLLDQRLVPGRIATGHLVQDADRTAFFVVVDTADGSGGKSTSVISFTVTESLFEPRGELVAGDPSTDRPAVTAMRAVGRTLVIARRDNTLSMVQLSAADGSMLEGNHVAAPASVTAGGMRLDGNTLRVVGAANESGSSELTIYDASDPVQLRAIASCMLAHTAVDPGGVSFLPLGGFSGTQGFLQSQSATSRTGLAVSLNAQNECQQAAFPTLGPGTVLSAFNGASALYLSRVVNGRGFEPAPDETQADIQLFASDRAPSAALASVQLASGDTLLWNIEGSAVLGTGPSSGLVANAADGSMETGLLSLPWIGKDQSGNLLEGLQFFTFSEHTLTQRGSLQSAARAFLLRPGIVATLSQADLTLLDTSSVDRIQPLAKLHLGDAYDDVIRFDAALARQQAGILLPPLLADRASVRTEHVELIVSHDNAQTAAAVGNVALPAFAQVVRTDDLLLSLSPILPDAYAPDQGYGPNAGLTVDVFDVSDASHPQARGSLSMPWPGLPHCNDATSTCTRDGKLNFLAVPHGLVLLRYGKADTSKSARERRNDIVGFSVLDVRDAAQPVVTQITPDAGRVIKSAFVSGSSLYYSYYVPADPGSAAASASVERDVRFYFVQVDLTDPSRPSSGAAIRAPGELLATDSQGALYTSELLSHANQRSLWLHKLERLGNDLTLIASHSLGDATLHTFWLDDQGHIVIDLMGPDWDPLRAVEDFWPDWGPATRLLVLATGDLTRLAELTVDRWSMLRAVGGGRAILQGIQTGRGIFVVDLHAPASPRLQAFHWADTSNQGALLFDGNQIIVPASRGLFTIDATLDNL